MSAPIDLRDKIQGSLFGFFIGDALAMPVHWYYNLDQLRSDFPRGITKYEAPRPTFAGSIMNLSNTGGGGRGSDKGSIVGDVILHGKKQFWLKSGQYHYHHGMKPGENTLDALVTRLMVKSLTQQHGLDTANFQQAYVDFMTTPGSHNDTYAGTCHRMFFKNFVEGKPLSQCPDNDGHNVDSIDSLMIIPPIAMLYRNAEPAVRYDAVRRAVQATRRITELDFAYLYSDMLVDVLNSSKSLQEVAVAAGRKLGFDVAQQAKRFSRSDPMTACYLDSAFPAMLVILYKYHDDVPKMLLASANAGGENVARGSLLGALAGASCGLSKLPPALVDDLLLSSSYKTEFEQFHQLLQGPQAKDL